MLTGTVTVAVVMTVVTMTVVTRRTRHGLAAGPRSAIMNKRNSVPERRYGTPFRFDKHDGGGNGAVHHGDEDDEDAERTARPDAPRSDAPGPRRKDARRNKEALLDAAAAVFLTSGVDAPVRDIAARAGVGLGTIYRHFPTRADLIIAVYRHQVDACAEAGPALLETAATPHAALGQWIDRFADFLVTKHGLAAVLRSGDAGFDALHAYFLDRLVPVCAELLEAAAAAGEIRADIDAYGFLRGVGNLCIGADSDPRYDARRLVGLLVAGLRRPH